MRAQVPAAVRLSKSRVMAGLQCHKLLWWMVHEPAAPELDGRVSLAMDQGIRVGELARTHVPRGLLIELPYDAYAERLAATREALGRASVLYEAAFVADNVFVSVDILERRGSGYCLIGVKSTTRVKEHHLPDVAIQAHILLRSGVNVTRMEVMHLNRECVYPDLTNLFIREDVTEAVEGLLSRVEKAIVVQAAMLGGSLPSVQIGDHCSAPYECPFIERCWPVVPPHHVSTLYAMRQRALELDEDGYHTIHDLPDEVILTPIADRQRRAVQAGQVIVEPGLAQALGAFAASIVFLDFETVGLAVPVWTGCHPYDAVPVQFSCHVVQPNGDVTHHAWLADGPEDPRPALVERLVAACEGARTVVAYHAPFEQKCLLNLADAVPGLAGELRHIADRLTDLLPVVRNYVYHPDFGGSFSLKTVLPALVQELRYDGLTIADGESASLELVRLLFEGECLEPEAREELRSDLLQYCHQDTWGLVKLLERLRQLGRGHKTSLSGRRMTGRPNPGRGRDVGRILCKAFTTSGVGIFGVTEMPEDAPPRGVQRGSRQHALFITLTVTIDYQRDAHELWRAARSTYEDPATRFVFYPERLTVKSRPALVTALRRHGLSRKHHRDAGFWYAVASTLHRRWDDDPRRFVKACGCDAPTILDRLVKDRHDEEGEARNDFPNLRGRKIGPLWVRMLHDNVGLPIRNLKKVPIPVDVHIARATFSLGVLRGRVRSSFTEVIPAIQGVWAEAADGVEHIALDYDEPLWYLSKFGCSRRRGDECPRAHECPVASYCVDGKVRVTATEVDTET